MNRIHNPTFHYKKQVIDESYWEKVGRETLERDFPIQLELELNTTCNLRCIMCSQPHKPEYMDIEDVHRLLKNGKEHGLISIKLQYRGEPLLYRELGDVLYAANDLGIKVHFNTNAQLLSPRIATMLIDNHVWRVICSIDSCNKDIYESIRVRGSFDTLLKNLRYLRDMKEKMGVEYPVVRIQAVKQALNREEIESGEWAKYWSPLCQEMAWEDEFNFYDITDDHTVLPDWHCEQLWQRLVVLANGEVLPCCCAYDYVENKPFSLGNISEYPIEEIWNGRKHKRLQSLHAKGESHKIKMCRQCRLRRAVIKQLEVI